MNYDAFFEVGDVVTINGLYADGTKEADETPPAAYRNAPLQYWRVASVGEAGVQLLACTPEGALLDRLNAWQEFWIRPTPAARAADRPPS